MIKTAILAAINKQIQHEQSNAHAYQAVSLYFGRVQLPGLAAFMAHQVEDERMHADKFIAHIRDRGEQVELLAIPAPKAEFASPLVAAKFVRDLERATTQTIHRLFKLARDDGDYALEVLLHWYITEQVEEEQWADELAAQMQQYPDQPSQLVMLDREWGKRCNQTESKHDNRSRT